MTRFTLLRGHAARSFRIAGTDLVIHHTRHLGFVVTAIGCDTADWVRQAGLRDVVFARRADLLETLAAHMASHPVPVSERPPSPTLIRRADGSYVTAEGDFEARPLPAGSFAGWQLVQHTAAGPIPSGQIRTLHLAAEDIRLSREADRLTALRDPDL